MHLFIKQAELHTHGIRKVRSIESFHGRNVDTLYSLRFFHSRWWSRTVTYAVMLLSVGDHISNVIFVIMLWKSKLLSFFCCYLVAWVIVGWLQIFHCIMTWRTSDHSSYYRVTSTSDNICHCCHIFILCFIAFIGYLCCLLPFSKLFFTSFDNYSNKIQYAWPSQLKIIFKNQRIYSVLSKLFSKLELFFFRIVVETIPFAVLILFTIFVCLEFDSSYCTQMHQIPIINDDYNNNNNNNNNNNARADLQLSLYLKLKFQLLITLIYNNIILLSLGLKFINLSLVLFILQIKSSYKISIHLQLSSTLAAITDITRYLSSFIVVLLVCHQVNRNSRVLFAYMYFVPCLIPVVIITFFRFIQYVKNTAVNANCCCLGNNPNNINTNLNMGSMIENIYYITVFIIGFPITLMDTQLRTTIYFDFMTIRFFNVFFLQNQTWHETNCPLDVVRLAKYQNYYSTLTKIAHYLANYHHLNIKFKDIHNNIKLNQQIGCLNYQIVSNCVAASQIEPTDRFLSRNVYSDEINFLTSIGSKLQHSQQTQLLRNSIQCLQEKDTFKDNGKFFLGIMRKFENRDESIAVYLLSSMGIINTIDKIAEFERNKCFSGLLTVLVISFIISRINIIIFPFYWWILIDNEDIINLDIKLKCLVNVLLYLTIVLYIATFYIWIRYHLPLVYKIRHVLPLEMLSNLESKSTMQPTIRRCARADVIITKFDGIADRIVSASIQQYEALQNRPLVQTLICRHFGHDVGKIVLQYTPIWDQTRIDDRLIGNMVYS